MVSDELTGGGSLGGVGPLTNAGWLGPAIRQRYGRFCTSPRIALNSLFFAKLIRA